jgi:hypothetical protein
LFDISTNLNCIKEEIVSKWFLQSTTEKLSDYTIIEYKTQASVFNNRLFLKNFFVITNDINHIIILSTLSIDMSTP